VVVKKGEEREDGRNENEMDVSSSESSVRVSRGVLRSEELLSLDEARRPVSPNSDVGEERRTSGRTDGDDLRRGGKRKRRQSSVN